LTLLLLLLLLLLLCSKSCGGGDLEEGIATRNTPGKFKQIETTQL